MPLKDSEIQDIISTFVENTVSTPSEETSSEEVEVTPYPDQHDSVDAMKKILENFHSVEEDFEKVTTSLVYQAVNDPLLHSALLTEGTENGAVIGEWEIRVKQNGKRKLYDVVSHIGVVIAADLTLYEAAFGIARSLANGEPITCKMIRDILILEGDYSRSLTEAIHFKHNLEKNPTSNRRMIMEDRFDAAKAKARNARRNLEEMVKPPF